MSESMGRKPGAVRSIILILILLTVMLFLLDMVREASPSYAENKGKGSALVKSVTYYTIGADPDKWIKDTKTTYKYKKKYPSIIKEYNYGSKETNVTKYKYKIRKGLPVRAEYMIDDQKYVRRYNKKGNLVAASVRSANKLNREDRIFQYATKGYFTLMHYERVTKGSEEEGTVNEYSEEIDQIMVTKRNGLLKKTVNNGLYANWDDSTRKVWRRFDGTYIAYYDRSGIAKLLSARYKTMGYSGKQAKFVIKKKNGRVTKVIKYNLLKEKESDKGKWVKAEKFVFDHYDTPISKKRYAAMINNIIMISHGTHYIYNWY